MEQSTGFQGARVVSFESRRSDEMAQLIRRFGGVPIVAKSMREAPIESNQEALDFAAELLDGQFDMAVFLTGVGTEALAKVAAARCSQDDFAAALRKIRLVARGPKPVAALKKLGAPADVQVPEPNTWRELLSAIGPLSPGFRVAVQEYGVSNPQLIEGLREQGAAVRRVPVYRWELPEDLGPLRQAVGAIAGDRVQAAVFTTSVQVNHLFRVASVMGLDKRLRRSLVGMMVASVGPVCSEALQRYGLHVDLEPQRPKMGLLIKEAAERSSEILASKRAG